MKVKEFSAIIAAIVVIALGFAGGAGAAQHDDRDALKGLRTGKAIFDINTGDPDRLVLYLSVIKETYQGLKKQKVQPDIIVAFRGGSVGLVAKDAEPIEGQKRESLEKLGKLVSELKGMGVKFEACSIATRLFEVDNSSLLPGIKVVGNTFISLIGYQSMGYAVIPIM